MSEIPAQTCWGCVQFDVDYEGDWSEITPGAGLMITCRKAHFYLSGRITQAEFAAAMEQGFTCADFIAANR